MFLPIPIGTAVNVVRRLNKIKRVVGCFSIIAFWFIAFFWIGGGWDTQAKIFSACFLSFFSIVLSLLGHGFGVIQGFFEGD